MRPEGVGTGDGVATEAPSAKAPGPSYFMCKSHGGRTHGAPVLVDQRYSEHKCRGCHERGAKVQGEDTRRREERKGRVFEMS